MTAGTDLAEVIGHVIRVGCGGEIGLMTSVACCRRVYISGGVTGDAGKRGVGAGQGKGSSAMIECRRQPGGGSVTAGANLAEIVGHVIRIGCGGEIGLMTGIAGRGGVYVTGGVTGDAGKRGMGAGQGKGRSAMIEGRRQPGSSGVTAGANLAKIVGHVIRVGSALKIGLMTSVAGRGCVHVTGRMTRNTGEQGMCAG